MTQGIYCYIDKKNDNIIYIGKDSYINKSSRHKAHLSKKKYNEQQINRVLQNNPERYDYHILKEGDFSQDELNQFEIDLIKEYNPLFNFTDGGDGALGYHHTEEAKEKVRKAMIGKQHFRGKTHSEKAKKRMSLSKLGEKNPMKKKENRDKVSKTLKKKYENGEIIHPQRGKHLSDKTKKKLSKTQSKNHNTTGYYRVMKHKSKSCSQEFIWEYRWTNEFGKRQKLCSVDLKKLEKKVKENNLPWEKLNE